MIHILDFLQYDDALRLHQDQIDRYGGSHGVRDHGLLESALAQPQAGLGDEYAHQDLFEMAGAYLDHLVQNHPFCDGYRMWRKEKTGDIDFP